MDGFAGNIEKHKKGMRQAGLAMTGAVAGVGIASVKMGGDFDTAMREVNTMMGLSESEFQKLKDDTLALSTELGKAPTEMAKALYQVISAGVPAGNALEFLGTSAKAAVGGVTDTETAVDGITTVVNAFKMSADDAAKVADVMFETVKRGKTNFELLSSSMYIAAPLAATLGVKFEEVMAATATLTKQGVPTAQAMTQVRASLVALTKPSEDMKVLLEKMGYSSGEAAIAALGYSGTLDGLRQAADNNNETLGTAFGRVEGLNALFGLTGDNAEMFAQDLEGMGQATEGVGASMEAFNEMNKSVGRQFEQTTVQLKGMFIEISSALLPALTSLVEAMAPILKAFGEWASNNPELTLALMGVTGAVGALLLVLPPLMSAYTAVKAIQVGATATTIGHTISLVAHTVATWAATAAATAFAIAVNLALWPILLVVAAALMYVAVAYLIIKNWSKITGFFKDLWENVYQTFVSIWDKIQGFVKDWGLIIMGLIFPPALVAGIIMKWGDDILAALTSVFNKIVETAKMPINSIIELINLLTGKLSGFSLGSFEVPSWIPELGGKSFDLAFPEIPKIPALARGGIVTKPTLAMFAEKGPEAVVPLDRMGGMGGKTEVHIHAGAIMGTEHEARKFARLINKYIQEEKRLSGYT